MLAWTLGVALLAQGAPVVEPGAEVRALTATILDESGTAVAGLVRDDVALLENGIAREITSFHADRRPLSVAVLVDTSAAMRSDYRLTVVDAVSSFVSRLPENTRYAVWTTGDRPTKVVDYTDEKAAANRALIRVYPQGGNYMLDAVSEASRDLHKLTREGDRTVLVAVTSTGPEFSYRDKFRSAEDAEENVDLFLAAELDAGGGDFDTRSRIGYVFDRVSKATGGRLETVLSALSTDSALRKLSPWLDGGYRVAYATLPDLKKRDVELSVARPATRVFLPRATDVGTE
jgi:VWFA-related protein